MNAWEATRGFHVTMLERNIIASNLAARDTVKCIFLSSRGTQPVIVSVPSLAGQGRLTNHQMLDVFMWLPGMLYGAVGMADTAICRPVIFGPGGIKYVVIHYLQDENKSYDSEDSNFLLEKEMTVERDGYYGCVSWQRDVLVVKTNNDESRLLNATDNDIEFVLGTLTRLIMTGIIA
ncbi:hypothetical protein CPC08DRAFT_770828 [Agrocybe pediades]|nr:hypothetical protein CPC08DRAFT_770828 [Agrocybe pediades]